MAELPSGTVTFLFTDLEGSTRLWEEHPDAMKSALARHDEILRDAITEHGGNVVKSTGDGFHAVFPTAHDALDAAVATQRALASEGFAETGGLGVRMGVHTCEAEHREGDYYGSGVNRAARLMSVAHGGQIVCSAATAHLARDGVFDGVVFTDLGEHRLRDLSRAERIFQVRSPDLRGDFPALASLDAFSANLPVQLTTFVGREQESAALAKAFEDARLVTVTGTGGVGKTRLSLQVAAEILPRFADGVWLCELAAAGSAEAMLQVVAATLGVAPRPGLSLEGSIRDYLVPKSLLLLLDNCEHLLDPVSEFAEGVLKDCRGVRILATSREALGIAGERVTRLRSLPVGGDDSLENDAACLFVDRARAVDQQFAADLHAQAVTEICRRLDGVPLAIELAAARVSGMAPGEIAGLLDERFRLLTGGRRGVVERHQTLRATVDWSYSLLEDNERIVFERLGVFPASFDTAAATAVVSDDDLDEWTVREVLASLVAKSMVVREDGPAGSRYVLLETLRQYARERLAEKSDPDIWRRRHTQYYLGFAEAAHQRFGPDALAWFARVRVEVNNLRAAVFWALDRPGEDAQCGVRLVAQLGWITTMSPELVGEWAEAALGHLDSAEPPYRTAVLAIAAFQAGLRGDSTLEQGRAVEALRDGLPAGTRFPAFAHYTLAYATASLGDPAGALAIIAEGHAALDSIARDDNVAEIRDGHILLLSCSGIAHGLLGDQARARADGANALRLARASGDPIEIGGLLAQDAVWWRRDDPSAVRSKLEESVELLRPFGNSTLLSIALAVGGHLDVLAGRHRSGVTALREAMTMARDTGSQVFMISVIDWMLHLGEHLGDPYAIAVLGGALNGPLGDVSFVFTRDLDQRAAALQSANADLATDEYEAAFHRGAAMSPQELVAYALTVLDERLANSDHV